MKLMKHNAKVRMRMEDEEARHRATLVDLSDREREIHASAITAMARSARLTRIAHQRAEEMRRHRAALDHLKHRLR
jgi:hypothetical protein